jgi:hypothetical protein
MKNLILALFGVLAGMARAGEVDDFSNKVYQVVFSRDFKSYSSLLHPGCKLNKFSEKTFQMRSDLLHKQKPGGKVEAIAISAHKELKAKSGNPFEDVYSVEPSHYAVVWPVGSEVTHAIRIDLNPIVKTSGDWKILDGSCVSAKKK